VGLIGDYSGDTKRNGSSSIGTYCPYSTNTERNIPIKRSVHHVPLDDTMIVVADDPVLPAPVLVLKLGLTPDVLFDPEEFPANSRLS